MNEKSKQESKSNQNELSQQNACEILSIEKISQLMDVEKSTIKQKDMSFGKRRSICYYFTKEGNRKFYIRLAWKSEKAKENRVLQKQYENFMSNGDHPIKEYQELSSTEQSQILYGRGQDHENKYIHVLRKRFNNQAEIQLEVTKENKEDILKDVLLEVINGIN